MKTLVELAVSKKVNSKIIKEVIQLSKVNTPNPNKIVVKRDAIDDRLLLIIFESFKGKQMDLVDDIMKSYSHFLDCYDDISVQFETRNKTISIEERVAFASKKEVTDLIESYFHSIDKQDWELLSVCLGERIKLIPKPSIRSSIKGVKASTYISYKQKVLSGITLNHVISNLTTARQDYEIKCQCQVEIKGAINETNDYFTALGVYKFSTGRSLDGTLKILKIQVEIENPVNLEAKQLSTIYP